MNGIFWIGNAQDVPLAVVTCPRGDEKLTNELAELKDAGIGTVVSLLEPDEAVWLGLGKEARAAEQAGLQFLSFPIPDGTIPLDAASFQSFVAALANRLAGGEPIGIHCRGSIGRATIAAACTLIHLGWKPGPALAAVEAARGCPVPETRNQERWILNYRPAA